MSLGGSSARAKKARSRLGCEQLEQRQMMDASFQFDFEAGSSPVAAGYTPVQLSVYTPTQGFGWQTLNGLVARDYPTASKDALRRDVHIGVRGTFLVDLPNGTYDVTPTLGNPRTYADNVSVFLEGQRVGRVSTGPGKFAQPTYRVTVTDGQLTLGLVDGSGKGPWFGIAGLTITPVVTAPTPPPPAPIPPPPPGAPVVNAGPDLISNEGTSVQFNGAATGGAGALTYWWDFGDGQTATGTLNPTHTYADNGNYTVTLRATDANGLVGQDTAAVTINNLAPTATLSSSGPAGEGSPVTFSFTNPADPSSVDVAAGFKYSYDFNNDGTFDVVDSTSASRSFAFADNGTYTMKGRIKDKDGGFTDYTTTVTISNVAPTASHNGPYTGTTGQAVTFNGSATDPSPVDAASLALSWSFGDGTSSTQAQPVHTYAGKGTYNVTFTATDKDGATHTVATTATISDPLPTPPPGSFIVTPWDRIPNFGFSPTIISAVSGNWSDPNTWSLGRTPTTGDVVAITQGTTVTYDLVSDLKLDTITVHSGGLLTFRTDVSTRVVVKHLLVLEGGQLRVGTVANPVASNVKAEIVIADSPIDTARDPEQWGNGLIALGKVTMHGAALSDTFVRLAAEPKAGDTTLKLSTAVIGWRVGDKLFLPDTRNLQWNEREGNYVPQWEDPTIAAISADGLTITLSSPLQFNPPGARDGNGVLEFLPHVANRSRNVVVRSEKATGTRGHVLFTYRADVDVRYVNFGGLGRTRIDPDDDTTFDANGLVTHIGTNQGDRNAVQFRHLIGPSSTPANGYQYTFVGNAVTCPLDPMPFLWGINVNDSHYGLIKDNVLWNWAGAGLVTKTGSESFNVIEHNMAARIKGTGARFDSGRDGVGFWFHGPNNSIRDNVATDIRGDAEYTYGFSLWFVYTGNQTLPAFKGADHSQAGQGITLDMNGTPLREFARNEVYGASRKGITYWWINTFGTGYPRDGGPSVIKDMRIWNVYEDAVYHYEVKDLTLDGLVVRGQGEGTGLVGGDYVANNFTIRNADIQGMATGIFVPTMSDGGTFTIEDSYLRNGVNIQVTPLTTSSYRADVLQPRKIIVRNVRFDAPQGGSLTAIKMDFNGGGAGGQHNWIQKDQVFVYDYNGIAGNNFQVFFKEQAAGYVVPQTVLNEDGTPNQLGSPEDGLTNQQNWSKYRIAIGGEVAPDSSTTLAGIDGLVNFF